MLTLKKFYRAHKLAVTSDDCARLPTACITPVAIAFSRVARELDMRPAPGEKLSDPITRGWSKRPFTDLFNPDFTAKTESLSPLTQNVLSAMNAAGLDLTARTYDLTIERQIATPASKLFWHCDMIWDDYNFRERILRQSRCLRTVLTSCYPTVTLPIGAFDDAPTNLNRSRYFLCQLKSVTGNNVRFRWRDVVSKFGRAYKNGDTVLDFVDAIRARGKELTGTIALPPSHHALHFNLIMPHAYTCHLVHKVPYPPNARLRYRIKLTSTPVG